MTKQEIVSKILHYQDDKNKLVENYTGKELIYDKVKVNLTNIEENLESIIINFSPDSELIDENCLHCNIYDNYCTGCPYKENDDECFETCSTYNTIVELLEGNYEFGGELYELSKQLRSDLDGYKEKEK